MTESPPHYETRVADISAESIALAAALIREGRPVAIPTETVYGLACDATNADAVAQVYAAKGRPSFNPLIAHVTGLEMARQYVAVPRQALDLMARFWPGPLTLVLTLCPETAISSLVTAGLPTLAIRCPDHPVAQALIASVGRPLAAPSANASGRISPTRAEHVLRSLGGRIPLILDAGPTTAGVESTIVAVTRDGLRLLREGAIPAETLGLGRAVTGTEGRPSAPGQLMSHYAPRQPVRLNALSAMPGEFLIGFGDMGGDVNLSPSGDLVEAAARLFDLLHIAEDSGRDAIAIAPVPDTGLGRAINDRLRRAAAERPLRPS